MFPEFFHKMRFLRVKLGNIFLWVMGTHIYKLYEHNTLFIIKLLLFIYFFFSIYLIVIFFNR